MAPEKSRRALKGLIEFEVDEEYLSDFIRDWEDIRESIRQIASVTRAVVEIAEVKELELAI